MLLFNIHIQNVYVVFHLFTYIYVFTLLYIYSFCVLIIHVVHVFPVVVSFLVVSLVVSFLVVSLVIAVSRPHIASGNPGRGSTILPRDRKSVV